MTCEQVNALMLPFLQGSLLSVQQQRLLAHVQGCDRCAQRLAEAQALDDLLYSEAARQRPYLSPDASLRIQENVYRKMRRSLVWRHTGQMMRMGTAVLVALVLLVVGMGFGQYWLTPLNEAAGSVETSTAVQPIQPLSAETVPETAVVPPQSAPPIAAQIAAQIAPQIAPLSFGQNLRSATPGATPEQIARQVVAAALAQDAATLGNLLVAAGAQQKPATRLWLRFGLRCAGAVPDDTGLQYETLPIPLDYLSVVRLHDQGRYVGEVKLRQFHGEWYATFTIPPLMNRCLMDRFEHGAID